MNLEDLIFLENNKVITFRQWLLRKRFKDSAQGDLMLDIRKDNNFPNTYDYNEMASYLRYRRAPKEAKDELRRSYKAYVKAMKSKKGLLDMID